MNIQEEWRPVQGFEEKYQVSNYGRIKSLEHCVIDKNGKIKPVHEKILNPTIGRTGSKNSTPRSSVEIWRDNKRKRIEVHRLVAAAFMPNPNNKPQINHIDGNPQNNCVDNLEWCTAKENLLHAYKTGLRKPFMRPVRGMHPETKVILLFKSVNDAGKYFGVTSGAIRAAIRGYGRSKGACGYKWEYQ